ncbi:pyridoxamine 5'-phosphate oxidase family protein [Streptomyces sp. HU2014]|uniref:pyridoxamine 5'-phosphate oxidase family protein n=1 Tax=Streptomyces sp. HU2014 TaxID=2939414 RepID=UPI0020106160|nr:pyridoxamine 5'-phosphate oxidase family protein [Streptomyces sp. HU2014]UQI46434.1 pyridoxamine 5'-phosphate oxidase family protein [Streptomyces sp. HU2014]
MPDEEPRAELDARYSSEGATATEWQDAVAALARAEVYWLTTVRPDGRPHVTPLIGVWTEGALYFSTGVDERKARNLRDNPRVVLTTGCNRLDEGFDLVVEGEAARVTGAPRLRALAEAWEAKYSAEWHFEVEEGGFVSSVAGEVLVFEVAPRTAFGFRKGELYSQTRWRFA